MFVSESYTVSVHLLTCNALVFTVQRTLTAQKKCNILHMVLCSMKMVPVAMTLMDNYVN
jgi:hypothetical protein